MALFGNMPPRDDQFTDRVQASQKLANQLMRFKSQNPVILGIPRGGVVLASIIADKLDIDFDVILTRKIGAPMNPELAIGSVSEDGHVFLQDSIVDQIKPDQQYIESEKEKQLSVIRSRTDVYRKIIPKTNLEDRIVIITDDGIATGATMQAAVWSAKAEKAAKVIAALPVGAKDSIRQLENDADEVICLKTPPVFYAISQFYSQFDQVSDEEVIKMLEHQSQRKVNK